MSYTHWEARGHGTLTFTNGRSVTSAWKFSQAFGYAPGKMLNALKREASTQKIPGRSKIQSFECTIWPINIAKTAEELKR